MMMQRTANENAACKRRICKRSDQPKIDRNKTQQGGSCLPMDKRVEIIHFAGKNPSFGYRKIASAFCVGRTQVQSIIKKKEEILTAYQSNLSKDQKQKRHCVTVLL